MRLINKFLLLVGFVSLSVLFNAGATAWSMRQLRTELIEPLARLDRVLGGLNSIKRDVWRQATLLHVGDVAPSIPGDPLTMDQLREKVLDQTEEFAKQESHPLLSGVASTRVLHEHIERSQRDVSEWIESPGASRAQVASESLLVVHELIERIESKLIRDSGVAVGLAADLSQTIVLITATSVFLVGLTILLAAVLFRRWVLTPVDELRRATDHIASGDYTYRIVDLGTDEIGRLAAEVNSMAGLVERTQRERIERERLAAMGEMTRRIVHNLRNPLAGIRGLAEVSRADAPENSLIVENQRRIIGAVDQFEEWLRSLLDVTRPLELEMELQEIGPMIDRVIGAHQAMAESVGVRITSEADPALGPRRFDSMQLEQALAALVANAVQASPEGGEIQITAGPDQNGSWIIRVEDEGEGVPAEARERLFEPWFTTKTGGTGIGLAMAKGVAIEHGGSIACKSRSGGRGARFIIRLPK